MSNLTSNYTAQEKTTEILDSMKQTIGMVPNIYKLMGHSPNVLEGYLGFTGALAKGSLSAAEREQIALAVAGFNHCQYCASAHTLLAKKAGVAEEETKNNLKGHSDSPRTQSLIQFVLKVLETKGFVSEADLEAIKNAGFSDEQIVEIVANVCTNIFTNYFNHVAGTEIDFPKVELE